MAKSETTEVHHRVKAQGTYLFLSFFLLFPVSFGHLSTPRMQKLVTRMLQKCTMFLRPVQSSTESVNVSTS